MSYTAYHKDFAPFVNTTGRRDETNSPEKIGFWRRLFVAARNYRQRRAEREIVRYIQSRGGHLNDQLERDLMRHMTSSPYYWGLHL
jgi:hypothetical protein